jgi:2-aminoadipate transaminase
LASKGIQASAEEILITNGSQQGIDLLSRVLLDPQDLVGVENPGYLGALITYNNYQARLLPLAMDQDGLLPEALEAALKAGQKPKLLYLTPSFQNPSGRLLSQARRLKILELCEKHQILLAEDDPYGEINFGEPYQPIKAFDKGGAVVFLGSFSKIASPGMRLGWAVGPKELIAKMVMAKESADVCTNVLSQAMAAEFLDGGHLAPHLKLLVQTYAARARAMVKGIRSHLGKELEVEDPKGGFFLWGRLAQGQRGGEALFKECLEAGVAYVPGHVFFADPSQGDLCLRLTYCAVDEEKIEEGVGRLAKVLQSAKARV